MPNPFATETNGAKLDELDPFVKRVVTVKSGDVVIFRFPTPLSSDRADEYRAQLEKKMGDISFLIIGSDIDLTVLKQSSNSSGRVHIA